MDSDILFFNHMTMLTTEQSIKNIHNILSLGYVLPVKNKMCLVLDNFKNWKYELAVLNETRF